MTVSVQDLRRHPGGLPPGTPGTKRYVSMVFGSHPDGSPAGFPLIEIEGAKPGTTAVFVAGVHGDEYEGPAALWQFADAIDPARLSGRVRIVPIANGAAFSAASRTSPVDDVNLARIFPGDPAGTLSHRLADALMRYIVEGADLLVDSHSGGSRLAFAPVAGFYAADAALGITAEAAEKSLELARSMRLASLWRLPATPGVLSCEAARRGIAVTGCEIGGRGGCLAEDVALYLEGYRAVLADAGMVPGSREALSYPHYLEGDWVRSDEPGYLDTQAALGSWVQAGETIATLRDSFGRERRTYRATEPGFVMAVRHQRTLSMGDLAICVVQTVRFDAA